MSIYKLQQVKCLFVDYCVALIKCYSTSLAGTVQIEQNLDQVTTQAKWVEVF